MVRTNSDAPPPEIVLVTSTGCHMCEMAKDTIAAVGVDFPVEVRMVDMTSPEGEELARAHRMPFPPLVLIDGQVHGYGRLSEKKFRRALGRLAEARETGSDMKDRT